MKKPIVVAVLLVGYFVTLFAQDASPLTFPPPFVSTGGNFDLVQSSSQQQAHTALLQGCAMAGGLNAVFGLWSFLNHDLFGELMTGGLELGVPILYFISLPFINAHYQIDLLFLWLGMYAAFIPGPVFGYVRGFQQYKKQ